MITARELTAADWHRLNGLLAEALELEPPARTEWLATLPDDAHDLKPLLAQLLADAGATRLEGTSETLRPVVQLAAAAMAAMRHEQAGDRIGPWQLERLLAEGGMGAVWVAQRADGVMKRTAALKLPRAEWVDHGLAARIARERGILARLQHPHIAVLYDAGLGAEGRPYLALEYVDGVPIDVYCKGRDLAAVLRLFVQVVRAVAYAHGQLVIHRDLKPANVLVTTDGLPKLLDFGISKLIEGDTTTVDATALTRLAGRPMTLAYAAPEQVLALPITVTADIYALGVMLFELLTEARLYRSQEPRALEAEILRGDPRMPSEAATDSRRVRALKGDLDAIVTTALKRQPHERYDSAVALADDLERYLTGKPVRAQPDSRVYRLRKFVARNTLPVAAASAIVVALGIGLGVALWQANEARNQAQRATAMNTFVLSLIRTADPNASQQTRAADLAMLAAIESRIDAEFKGSPDQLLQLRVTVGDAYRNRGESAAAQRVFQRAVDEAAPLLPADDMQLLTARVRAADFNLIVSTAASDSLDGAIEILRSKGAAGADLLIDALLIRNELSNFFGVPAFTLPAQRFDVLNEALETARRHFGDGSRQQLKVVLPYAQRTYVFGESADAEHLVDTSLAQARTRTDRVTSSAEYHEVNIDRMTSRCGSERSAEVLSMLWEAVATDRAAHGDHSVQLERRLDALGTCLNAVDDPSAGWLEEDIYAIAAARERPPSTHLMRRAEGAFNGAMSRRDWDAAERYYQSAIENSQAISDPKLREGLTRRLAMDRVCLLAQRGDVDEAEQFAAPMAARFNAEFSQIGRLSPGQNNFWSCLSFAQRQKGRYAEAVRTAQTIIERCRANKTAARVACEARPLREQALAELDWGRNAEAMATMQERLKSARKLDGDPNAALAYGRALLANGRAQEAIEPLRMAYGSWLSVGQPNHVFAAEVEYWFGQAWIANGEVKRGRWMVAEAKRTLAQSPLPSHRALAVQPGP
jgi:tetratricopeptide (TPR) repeat protein/tRNA A-37 threonylcarbamoyl transferase component Bud32